VGYRWAGDLSFGLAVTDALARAPLPPNVDVADLGYGALYVALDLADARPPYDRVILVAGAPRGRAPGMLYARRRVAHAADDDEVQARVREAGAGVVDLDHLLVIARHFAALPDDVICVELEPVTVEGEALSPAAASKLADALTIVRDAAGVPALATAEA
jgi:hydrogenase maturation protease